MKLEAAFEITGWEQAPYDEPADGPPLTRATVRKAQVAALIPAEHRAHAESILATARGLVDWLAREEDALLAASPVAGSA